MHWACLYQQYAKRVVAKATEKEGKQHEIEAFCLVAAQITKATSQHEVFQLFQCLCGECMLSDVQHLISAISSEHLAHVNTSSDWSLASHWVQWWTRPSHLNKCFSDMPANRWDKCPATTNAVEQRFQMISAK